MRNVSLIIFMLLGLGAALAGPVPALAPNTDEAKCNKLISSLFESSQNINLETFMKGLNKKSAKIAESIREDSLKSEDPPQYVADQLALAAAYIGPDKKLNTIFEEVTNIFIADKTLTGGGKNKVEEALKKNKSVYYEPEFQLLHIHRHIDDYKLNMPGDWALRFSAAVRRSIKESETTFSNTEIKMIMSKLDLIYNHPDIDTKIDSKNFWSLIESFFRYADDIEQSNERLNMLSKLNQVSYEGFKKHTTMLLTVKSMLKPKFNPNKGKSISDFYMKFKSFNSFEERSINREYKTAFKKLKKEELTLEKEVKTLSQQNEKLQSKKINAKISKSKKRISEIKRYLNEHINDPELMDEQLQQQARIAARQHRLAYENLHYSCHKMAPVQSKKIRLRSQRLKFTAFMLLAGPTIVYSFKSLFSGEEAKQDPRWEDKVKDEAKYAFIYASMLTLLPGVEGNLLKKIVFLTLPVIAGSTGYAVYYDAQYGNEKEKATNALREIQRDPKYKDLITKLFKKIKDPEFINKVERFTSNELEKVKSKINLKQMDLYEDYSEEDWNKLLKNGDMRELVLQQIAADHYDKVAGKYSYFRTGNRAKDLWKFDRHWNFFSIPRAAYTTMKIFRLMCSAPTKTAGLMRASSYALYDKLMLNSIYFPLRNHFIGFL